MGKIEVEGLEKRFRGRAGVTAIDGVSFEVAEGEILVLLGPSGCGKTTTLRCLAGLENPDRGLIRFGDTTVYDSRRRVELPTHKRDIGLVFQSFALWPHMTSYKNIAFPLTTRRAQSEPRERAVEDVARLLDLDLTLLGKRPYQLSGGQQQRVSLARALVSRPSVILFDEPLSNLDALLREQLRLELRGLHRQLSFTGVYVTHDLAEALALGDRVAVMRDGRIEQIGAPLDVFNRPATTSVARLLGYRHVATVVYEDGRWTTSEGSAVDLDAGRQLVGAGRVDLYARPDSIRARVGAKSDVTDLRIDGARMVESVDLGTRREYIVELGARPLRLTQEKGEPLLPLGCEVGLDVTGAEAVFYDEKGALIPGQEGAARALVS